MTLFHSLATAAATAAALACLGLPALADGIVISDAYARSAGAMAKTGAAFMVIENQGPTDDRLLAAASDVAQRVELHTHKATADGVMQMMAVPEGFAIPAQGRHALARGGDHVMFLGLTRKLQQGDSIAVTLTFEKAGAVTVEIPVDLQRQDGMETMPMDGTMPQHGHGHGHSHGMATDN